MERAMPKLATSTALASEASLSTSSSTAATHSTSSNSTATNSMTLKPLTLSKTMPAYNSTTLQTKTALSSSSTETYSYLQTIPPSKATDGYSKNPYINQSTAPNNIVFIGVGAGLGFFIGLLVLVYLVAWLLSRNRAHREAEMYLLNMGSTSSSSFLLGSLSQLSFIDKSLSSSQLQSLQGSVHQMDSTTQGRTYREMLQAHHRRGSMTILPVLELLSLSRSNLELPLLDGLYPLNDNESPDMLSRDAYAGVFRDYEPELSREKPRVRPPSMVLDDLMDFTVSESENEEHNEKT